MPAPRIYPKIHEDILELAEDLRSAILQRFRVVMLDEIPKPQKNEKFVYVNLISIIDSEIEIYYLIVNFACF